MARGATKHSGAPRRAPWRAVAHRRASPAATRESTIAAVRMCTGSGATPGAATGGKRWRRNLPSLALTTSPAAATAVRQQPGQTRTPRCEPTALHPLPCCAIPAQRPSPESSATQQAGAGHTHAGGRTVHTRHSTCGGVRRPRGRRARAETANSRAVSRGSGAAWMPTSTPVVTSVGAGARLWRWREAATTTPTTATWYGASVAARGKAC